MFLTESKLEARIRELSAYRYRDAIQIPAWDSQVDLSGEIAAYPPAGGEWSVMRKGERWIGRDLYLWLRSTADVPEAWSGKRILGRFDFGDTGGGNNSGFESLFFLNGQPYQGVDSNHMEVFLPEDAAGSELAFDIRLWSGLEGGGVPRDQAHTINLSEICWLDEAADDLYYTSKATFETIKQLSEHATERPMLLGALDGAIRLIDWSRPGSDVFYASVYAAIDRLKAELEKIGKHHPVTVHCIGHTHIDVAWLWRLKHTREKCARSFSTVLRLMEQYPEYVFLQTQPQLYEYIKGDYPDIYEKIKERVGEGRWEAAGGMWLEADCNLTSGESLVRQILLGTRFLRDEFGTECDYLWLPDVFGYSWALPQILKKSGINTFMTTKISWNQYNRMPHDTFKWRGIDGTEILTHFITTPEPWSQPGSWFYTYNGVVTPKTVKGIWDAYRDKEVNRELLLSYGYGDGGGGVNREMLEMRRRLDDMPGLPQVKTGTAGQYFRKLQERVSDTDRYVHTWDGELYLEYHRGTYTSQAYNKRMNRKLELLYRETEWLSSMNSVLAAGWKAYPQAELNEGWKIVLRNQFHDIIPGSSIKEVYEDSRLEYAEAEGVAQAAWTAAATGMKHNGSDDGRVTVFNSANWVRSELVSIPAGSEEAGVWKDAEGAVIPSQRTGDKWHVFVSNIPSMGWSTIAFSAEDSGQQAGRNAPFVMKEQGIDTPHYEIRWNEQGQLISIWDKTAGREVLADGMRGNVLQVFEDKPLAHEAWDIDLFYQEKCREVVELELCEAVEIGPLQAVVRFQWRYMDSVIRQEMILYAEGRRIDFRTEADWQEPQQLLKAAFPVSVRATEATYDVQFGNVKRPTHWNTSWDYARFETVGQQWADLSERGYGVSLMNDCKYGYDIKDDTIRLSLIKSATHPDPDADRGHHSFTYSLLPHAGDWLEGNTVREAWALNNPLACSKGAPAEQLFSMLELNGGHVMVDAVKKAEDDNCLVVRLHEYGGARGTVEMTSGLPVASWQECDLMERPLGTIVADERLSFHLKPYEIKTFLVHLKQ
ncbi:alpha-mannosidase [Paenibacillus sp. J5C_2022]|uniref:alpha-mannosidase n=1 Tax=Paenibacillus sp. J5C2022 TaxID=2977129 RepID=UPI0021D16F12|nr:alpha-mannosidase [Paenibacillus sp. J5C2022]MCU6712337.1 alpha-mannosidase [Paenibacillus sp. J5C2022]